MAGLDIASGAVGVASLGIQVCQGLLSYYHDWRDCKSDIKSAYNAISDLAKTLGLLRASLERGGLDKERSDRVTTCLETCEDSLTELSGKLQETWKYSTPKRNRQHVLSEMQRLLYPFRKETLSKLKHNVEDIQARLALTVQGLQLDISIATETSVGQVSIQQQSLLAVQQSDHLRNISNWLSAPDPWTNHASAREQHEQQTGEWLVQSKTYKGWKAGASRYLWMYGKAGCGKTILSSTVIEDIQAYSQATTDTAFAMFYFSFSDDHKQTYGNLIRSLVAQLGWREPGLSMLRQAYDKPNRSILGVDDLEKILLSSIKSYDKVFVMLDALDESPEEHDTRHNVLLRLQKLARDAENVSLFVTSREARDIREAMESLGVTQMDIAMNAVDADILRYVSNEMSRDSRLRQIKPESQTAIKEKLTQKADGMFRWVYCQLHELKNLKSTKPKSILGALRNLPKNLDDTYTRMLNAIGDSDRDEAVLLLRWLAYTQSPPTLAELAEASIINLSVEDSVDIGNRGGIQDTLNILFGLVTTVGSKNEDNFDVTLSSLDSESDAYATFDRQRFSANTKVRLAHFSVKEFLESDRVPKETKLFHLESSEGHQFLAQSCLKYILHYSHSRERSSSSRDHETFPLLRLAAQSWYFHSLLQKRGDLTLEVSLLSCEEDLKAWLLIHQPDRWWKEEFTPPDKVASGLYYASYTGLKAVAALLLDKGANINAKGGFYGNALSAASAGVNFKVVQLLLDKGADINAQGGHYGNALQAALCGGHHTEAVQLLLDKGADVNAQGGYYGSALQAASFRGYTETVQLLLDKGADINAQGGRLGNALLAALGRGHTETVRLLLNKGADVNVQRGHYGNALQAASYRGHAEVVRLLLNKGADVNAQGGYYGSALQAASFRGYTGTVQLLLNENADVNAQGGRLGNALQAASCRGYTEAVRLLLDKGADVNAQGGQYGNAFQAASCKDHAEVVRLLRANGADDAT